MNYDPVICPKCGGAIPADAPQGLCPRCVLAAAAMPTEAARTTGPRVAAPPLENVRAAFPQLEIIELIGQGGMGVVYKARQPKLDRFVALKILAESLATDPTFEERFTREARMLAKLSHPNIVTIYDHGIASAPQTPDARPETQFYYLLMELVDGVNLRQAMAAGRFTATEALALVPRICEALQYAHDEGVLHRDIKPENILLDGRGRVKIADFGIAKMLGEAQPGGTLTASGASLGTPHYMSPEQIEHPSEVDHRTDIFSLGVVFYEMLTGELPLGRFGPPSAKSAVDRRVDEIVFRTLEKERELRQQSAGEVKTQLDTLSLTAAPPPRDPQPAGNRTPRILKGQGCILIRPETMATFEGQLFAYQNRGQLLLDEERLTFTSDGFPTVIPLAAITDLSIGRYPRSMNPAGINLISLNYTDGCTNKRIYLSPMEGLIGLPSTRNRDVADWHSAIREAVVAATGKPPGETPAEQLGIPRGRGIGLLLILGPAVVVAISLGAMIGMPPGGSGGLGGSELFMVSLPIIAVVAGFITMMIFFSRHGRTTPSGDGNGRGKARSGWVGTVFLILFLFGSVFLATFAVYQRSARRSPALAAQPAPIVAEPARPLPTAVASAQANPPDPIRDLELKLAKQQVEKTLTELEKTMTATAKAEKELAMLDAIQREGVQDTTRRRKVLLNEIQLLQDRQAKLRKEVAEFTAPAKPKETTLAPYLPPALVQAFARPTQPLAHLTNALRVPFDVPAGMIRRFSLQGPTPPKLSLKVFWRPNSNLAAKLAPLPDGEKRIVIPAGVFRGKDAWSLPSTTPTNANQMVPLTDVFLERPLLASPLSGVVVSPDHQQTSGELVWEPMLVKKDNNATFPLWRFWICATNQAPVQLHSGVAPWPLPHSFVWPTFRSVPNGSIGVSPLHLDESDTGNRSGVVPSPSYHGPSLNEWLALMTNSLAECFNAVAQTNGVTQKQMQLGEVWFSNKVLSVSGYVPQELLPRLHLALDKAVHLLTLSDAEYVQRYGEPFGPGFGDSPRLPSQVHAIFKDLTRPGSEKLIVQTLSYPRPQAAYFPNDRVRVGLVANEAEIMAAIRNGSTNQVFNQAPTVKP